MLPQKLSLDLAVLLEILPRVPIKMAAGEYMQLFRFEGTRECLECEIGGCQGVVLRDRH